MTAITTIAMTIVRVVLFMSCALQVLQKNRRVAVGFDAEAGTCRGGWSPSPGLLHGKALLDDIKDERP